MADDNIKLTQDDKTHIKEWFLERAPNPCPGCGHRNWIIGDHLIATPLTSKSQGDLFVGTTYPFVQAVCTHCAYARFHNAILMGIVSNEAPQQDEGDGGEPVDDNG